MSEAQARRWVLYGGFGILMLGGAVVVAALTLGYSVGGMLASVAHSVLASEWLQQFLAFLLAFAIAAYWLYPLAVRRLHSDFAHMRAELLAAKQRASARAQELAVAERERQQVLAGKVAAEQATERERQRADTAEGYLWQLAALARVQLDQYDPAEAAQELRHTLALVTDATRKQQQLEQQLNAERMDRQAERTRLQEAASNAQQAADAYAAELASYAEGALPQAEFATFVGYVWDKGARGGQVSWVKCRDAFRRFGGFLAEDDIAAFKSSVYAVASPPTATDASTSESAEGETHGSAGGAGGIVTETSTGAGTEAP